MIRRSALIVIYLLLFAFAAIRAIAQPTLPDMEGSAANGVVRLTWTCQFDGVKAVSVLRSADSNANFRVIGFVKNVAKGVQLFDDPNPATGKNFYKLSVVFKSGLTWRTNYYGINVTKVVPETAKPTAPPAASTQYGLESDFKKTGNNGKKQPLTDTCKKTGPSVAISVGPETNTQPVISKHKIRLTYEDQDTNAPVFIKSRFIFVDSATGNINMFLPDDVRTRSYSVKFYDRENHFITEVPKINTSRIIFDKRNFQHKGIYKFVLRRDYTELEAGYINITPNP